MKNEEFDALIARLEARARENPDAYLRRTAFLVSLGYGYLALVLTLSLLLIVGIVLLVIAAPNALTIKLGFALGIVALGLAWSILKGVWVKLDPPAGLRLRRDEAPELFQMIDEVREHLRSQPFHEVVVNGDFNAAVVQVPRLGILGWHRNYLILGLPLMQALAPDEFKAVLAHEFGHLSANHSRFSGWIYRVRRTWERIIESIAANEGRGSFALRPFLNWYWPKFNAAAFVLSRQNEYVADACSAELAGAPAAGRALLRLAAQGSYIEEKFWPELFRRVNTESAPPATPFVESREVLRQPLPPTDAERWIRAAFRQDTNNADTHPCLRDRLQALGELPAEFTEGAFPPAPPPPEASAADALLGAHAAVLEQGVAANWRRMIEPGWKQRFEEVRGIQEQLDALPQVPDQELTPDDLWTRIKLLLQLRTDDEIQGELSLLLERKPDHAAGCFLRGRQLLAGDDPAGVDWIARALAADPVLTPEGLNLLHGYYVREGRKDLLAGLARRFEEHQEVMQLAQLERNSVTERNRFLQHQLTPADLEQLRGILHHERDVGRAYVARKDVKYFATNPLYVLCLELKVSWIKPRSSSASGELVNRIVEQLKLEGQFLVFVHEANLKPLGKAIQAVEGSHFYTRADLED